MDCAHSSPRADRFSRATRRDVAVYIYELPPELTLVPMSSKTGVDLMYTAELRFLETLQQDTAVRTLDPEDADLFFVPLLSYWNARANVGCPRAQLELVLGYIKGRYPFWRRSSGHDHVIFACNDMGGCGLGPVLGPAILVTHFGLAASFESFLDVGRQRSLNATVLREQMLSGKWCYSPHKDVVIPPVVGPADQSATPPDPYRSIETRLVHAGGIWGWSNKGLHHVTRYSQGMKQGLWLHYEAWRNSNGSAIASVPFGHPVTCFAVNTSRCAAHAAAEPSPWKDELRPLRVQPGELKLLMTVTPGHLPGEAFSSAAMCFSSSGEGFGQRTTRFALNGCVPLIGQPFVDQPFEQLLPYETFSQRLEFYEFPQLPARLRALTDDRVVRMRQALKEVSPAFNWVQQSEGRTLPALAYNFTILQLCQRAVQLQGVLKTGRLCSHTAAALRAATGIGGARGRSTPSHDVNSSVGNRRYLNNVVMPEWYPSELVSAVHAARRHRREAFARARKQHSSSPLE